MLLRAYDAGVNETISRLYQLDSIVQKFIHPTLISTLKPNPLTNYNNFGTLNKQ